MLRFHGGVKRLGVARRLLEERDGCLFHLCSSTLCLDAVLMKRKVEREEQLVVRDIADGGPHCSVMKEKCTLLMRN